MEKKLNSKRVWLFAAIVALNVACASAQNHQKNTNKKGKTIAITANAASLPMDTNVRTGKLANGFTYFIRHNIEPKNRVVFYLANKVGSVLEDDDQQGLAHFMEHMNFNGTAHFPKNQLVDYLQKNGVRFGADINAYTSFDETVYQLPLPSDKPDVLSNGIQIMRDWAQSALLDPVEIDKERGVVLEEKRLGKGASERMQRKYLPVMLNNSRYGQRLPIGLDTILDNFKPAAIDKFYHDWYRPDLQALIVVGDINVNEIEKQIREKFADLKNPANERIRTKYKINLTGKNQFIKVTDPEATSINVEVIVKREGQPIKTRQDYRAYLTRKLFNTMLADRFQEIGSQKNPPFVAGSAGISGLLGGIDAFSVRIVPNSPQEIEKGFYAAWREIERLEKFGFTEAELERAKRSNLHNLETSYNQRNTTHSDIYVNEILQYYLNKVAMPGIENELQMASADYQKIKVSDVNAVAKNFESDKNRDIIITAPDDDEKSLPGEHTVNAWVNSIKQEKLKPYKDNFKEQPLLAVKPVGGKIVNETKVDSINVTIFTLSNGMKVVVKPTKFTDGDVLVKGFSPGGSSVYSDADYQSANIAAYLATASGLGDYDFSHLNKFLSGTNIVIGPYISDYEQGFQAAASSNELETMLQMIYLYFEKPKMDSTAFNNYISQSKSYLLNRKQSPEALFDDTISTVLGNYSARRTGPSLDKLNQIDMNKAYGIFKRSFSDAANFTFTFVGDVDVEKLKPLIETYLGSLHSTYAHQRPKDLGIHPPSGIITKIVRKGIEPKASVGLYFSGPYDFGFANNLTMDAMAEVLQIRLIERLREDESGVYSPGVRVSHVKVPAARYTFSISFGCAPQNVKRLIASALDEVEKLKTKGPLAVNLEKFKAENMRSVETELKANDFWSDYLTNHLLNNENINDINRYNQVILGITPEQVKSTASKYLSGNDLITIELLPENVNP